MQSNVVALMSDLLRHLSAHTVRDHVKSIFRKTRVTSRGELVAKLYAEHYQPDQQHNVLGAYEG
jgi:hypothetical protein